MMRYRKVSSMHNMIETDYKFGYYKTKATIALQYLTYIYQAKQHSAQHKSLKQQLSELQLIDKRFNQQALSQMRQYFKDGVYVDQSVYKQQQLSLGKIFNSKKQGTDLIKMIFYPTIFTTQKILKILLNNSYNGQDILLMGYSHIGKTTSIILIAELFKNISDYLCSTIQNIQNIQNWKISTYYPIKILYNTYNIHTTSSYLKLSLIKQCSQIYHFLLMQIRSFQTDIDHLSINQVMQAISISYRDKNIRVVCICDQLQVYADILRNYNGGKWLYCEIGDAITSFQIGKKIYSLAQTTIYITSHHVELQLLRTSAEPHFKTLSLNHHTKLKRNKYITPYNKNQQQIFKFYLQSQKYQIFQSTWLIIQCLFQKCIHHNKKQYQFNKLEALKNNLYKHFSKFTNINYNIHNIRTFINQVNIQQFIYIMQQDNKQQKQQGQISNSQQLNKQIQFVQQKMQKIIVLICQKLRNNIYLSIQRQLCTFNNINQKFRSQLINQQLHLLTILYRQAQKQPYCKHHQYSNQYSTVINFNIEINEEQCHPFRIGHLVQNILPVNLMYFSLLYDDQLGKKERKNFCVFNVDPGLYCQYFQKQIIKNIKLGGQSFQQIGQQQQKQILQTFIQKLYYGLYFKINIIKLLNNPTLFNQLPANSQAQIQLSQNWLSFMTIQDKQYTFTIPPFVALQNYNFLPFMQNLQKLRVYFKLSNRTSINQIRSYLFIVSDHENNLLNGTNTTNQSLKKQKFDFMLVNYQSSTDTFQLNIFTFHLTNSFKFVLHINPQHQLINSIKQQISYRYNSLLHIYNDITSYFSTLKQLQLFINIQRFTLRQIDRIKWVQLSIKQVFKELSEQDNKVLSIQSFDRKKIDQIRNKVEQLRTVIASIKNIIAIIREQNNSTYTIQSKCKNYDQKRFQQESSSQQATKEQNNMPLSKKIDFMHLKQKISQFDIVYNCKWINHIITTAQLIPSLYNNYSQVETIILDINKLQQIRIQSYD